MLLLLMQHKIFLYTIMAIVGLSVGSFCNVVIHRLPIMLHAMWRKESFEFLQQEATALLKKPFNLFVPRSQCQHCQRIIPALCNIPVISFLLLRGKCHKCHAKISWRYPAVELLCGIATLFVAYYFGISWQMAAVTVLTWGLIILVGIDFEHQLLPDSISLSLLWLGLLASACNLFTTPENAIYGAVFGYSSLWLIAKMFKLIRKQDGMGHGDFKLLAVFGAWLGWQVLPTILFIAAIAGSIVGVTMILRRKQSIATPISFGPYLAAAGWLMFFAGEKIILWPQHLIFIHS